MSATSSRTRREGVYPALIGLAVGALVVGLVLPWTVDDEGGTVAAGLGAADAGTATPSTIVDPETGETITLDPATGAPVASNGTSARPTGSTASTQAGSASAPSSPASGEPIKVGFTLFDIAGASSLGFAIAVNPEDGKRAYQAFVDDANEQGGINGRPIEASYSVYDLTNEDDQLASCLELTEDHKVFAVIGGYSYSSANLCVVESHKTLLVNDNSFTIDELYRSGRHISMWAKGSRMMAAFASRLDKLGQLRGKKVGILADSGADPTGSTTDALAAAVEARGGTVARKSMLNGDFASGSSQIPVEVNQQRTSGVQLVLLIASPLYGTQFAQQAESQGWRPTYAATDWQAMYSDVGGSNMPNSFEGAYSITSTRTGDHRVGLPVTPKQQECIRTYERLSKTKMWRRGENGYGLVLGACDVVGLFVDAARRAGSELTGERVVAAAQGIGAFDSARWSGGSLGPGKFDVMDYYRVNRFRNDCPAAEGAEAGRCWWPSSAYERE